MEQRGRFSQLGQGEGGGHGVPSFTLPSSSPHSVVYRGGVDKGRGWCLDGLNFSSQGVAEAKTQGLACLPCLSAALPRNPVFLPPAACPTSQS